MCGRFAQYGRAEVYASMFGAAHSLEADPRYNVAPSQFVIAARMDAENEPEMVLLRWGLIPRWSQGPDSRYSMINARAETVHKKAAYREAYRYRRCLIPSEGFYEWRKQGASKQPYLICMGDHRAFAMAGIWESWRHQDRVIDSCSIIVTDANQAVRPIHDRMPVIIQPKDYQDWLDRNSSDIENLNRLLIPFPATSMMVYPVSPRLNNPRNEGRELIRRHEGLGDDWPS